MRVSIVGLHGTWTVHDVPARATPVVAVDGFIAKPTEGGFSVSTTKLPEEGLPGDGTRLTAPIDVDEGAWDSAFIVVDLNHHLHRSLTNRLIGYLCVHVGALCAFLVPRYDVDLLWEEEACRAREYLDRYAMVLGPIAALDAAWHLISVASNDDDLGRAIKVMEDRDPLLAARVRDALPQLAKGGR